MRARIVLDCASGLQSKEVAARLSGHQRHAKGTMAESFAWLFEQHQGGAGQSLPGGLRSFSELELEMAMRS
jgi:hypothetical protein